MLKPIHFVLSPIGKHVSKLHDSSNVSKQKYPQCYPQPQRYLNSQAPNHNIR